MTFPFALAVASFSVAADLINTACSHLTSDPGGRHG